MKMISIRTALPLSVAIVSLVWAQSAFGDAALEAKSAKEKVYKGTVLTVDPDGQTVAVKGLLLNKTFNAAPACAVSFEDKPEATLENLRPGHKVDVHYQKVRGVLVASKIVQHNQVIEGYITAIDPGARTLAVKDSGNTRKLLVAEQHSVMLKDDRAGTLENLKVGHRVSVAYNAADGVWTTHKIVQNAESFVGTIQAIDAGSRTVRARSYLKEKKFNLADRCQIIVEDKTDAEMRDLRIGDRVEFSYENANGVLVVTRIGREIHTPDPESAQTAKVESH
jgi:Cu/Ag efflux protein CusF